MEAESQSRLSMQAWAGERQGLGLRELVGQQSSLDQSEIQAIRSITAARKMKKAIELRGMRPNSDLKSAAKALQKAVDVGSRARSELLQLEERL